MALETWQFGTSDALTKKFWSKSVDVAERPFTEIAPLIGEGDDAIIKEMTEFQAGAGDEVTMQLVKNLVGDGFSEEDVAEGNGEGLAFWPFKFRVNELLHVAKMPGKDTISQKRVVMNLRDQAKSALARWHGIRKSVSFFNQVCGFTPESRLVYTGLNAVTAASANRIRRAPTIANDQSITSSHHFSLDTLDVAKTDITTGASAIRPTIVKGKKLWVCYIHPGQEESLRTSAGTAKWTQIQMAALEGGKEHGLYNGALGEYNEIILRRSQDVTKGVHSVSNTSVDNVRRAVILGASAACYAQKTLSNGEKMKWHEKEFDIGRLLEMAALKICGFKKTVYEAEDYGTYVLPTYSRV